MRKGLAIHRRVLELAEDAPEIVDVSADIRKRLPRPIKAIPGYSTTGAYFPDLQQIFVNPHPAILSHELAHFLLETRAKEFPSEYVSGVFREEIPRLLENPLPLDVVMAMQGERTPAERLGEQYTGVGPRNLGRVPGSIDPRYYFSRPSNDLQTVAYYLAKLLGGKGGR